MPWKYGLIKVADALPLVDRPECMLVELYDMEDNGEYNSYCKARINNPWALKCAAKDVERDGINEWFFNNGTFNYDHIEDSWIYTSKEGWTNPPTDP